MKEGFAMIKKVVKRNGDVVDFDPNKIVNAIMKASEEVCGGDGIQVPLSVAQNIALDIQRTFDLEPDVEFIQDMVEQKLMAYNFFRVAKAYMLYREKRAMIRKSNTTDESIMELIRNENKEMNEENSNKNPKMASTQRDYIAGIVSRDLTRRILLPEKISKAHDDGVLHFHDADYFLQPIHNCCLINIADMLDNGTVINGKMIDSPKSFQVACTVMTQIIAQVASCQYGGQSVDTVHLGKYLRRSIDKFKAKGYSGELLNERIREEVAAGVQTIQYQINTLMTTNGQSPFVTIFMYLRKDDPYKEENAMIIEEILKQREQGIKNEVGVYITPAFPKLIYVLTEENCLKGGEYDYLTKIAVKCSAKRMYPDYISEKKMAENYEGNVFSPMGK